MVHAESQDEFAGRPPESVEGIFSEANDPVKGGLLQFCTEIVGARDGSIVALPGASPGASTAPPIMIKVLKTACKVLLLEKKPLSADCAAFLWGTARYLRFF